MAWYPDGTCVEILEELENRTHQYAGDREWWWADHFGYLRGMHYSKSHMVALTTEERSTMASRRAKMGGAARGGRKGAQTQIDHKLGIHGLSDEQRAENARRGSVALAEVRKDPIRRAEIRDKRAASVQAYWDNLRADPEAYQARRESYKVADHQSSQARENHRRAALAREAKRREQRAAAPQE